MNEFFAANKKYFIILAVGLLMLVLPYFMSGESKTEDINQEQRFKEVIQNAKGVGKIEIMTNTTKEGKINGVVIVAQGAESVEIKKQISDAAAAAFDVQPHKIQIFSYKEEELNNEIK